MGINLPYNEDLVDSLAIKTKHLCWIYHNDEQRLAVVQPLLVSGLLRQRRCIIIAPQDLVNQIATDLVRDEINVDKYTTSKQLLFMSPEEFLLTKDVFDADLAISRLQATMQQTLASGWVGLTVVSDASNLVDKIKEADWLNFELQVEQQCAAHPCIALCLIDDRKVSGSLITALIKVHPAVGLGENLVRNPFYIGFTQGQAYPM